ncbi:hypothetical protein B0H10DRAFT_2031246 [Mycena sp. CBHHK59/15]|nr:hypothetical protein B0H10DRAFT_2031246 [Mycena sp. CBHHK59/15]
MCALMASTCSWPPCYGQCITTSFPEIPEGVAQQSLLPLDCQQGHLPHIMISVADGGWTATQMLSVGPPYYLMVRRQFVGEVNEKVLVQKKGQTDPRVYG